MIRLFTIDDIIDLFYKTKIKGKGFMLSKLNPRSLSRTKSTFNTTFVDNSNWWIIPKVKERWNKLITDNQDLGYKDFFMESFFKDKKNLKLISLGTGSSHHEIELAKYANFKEIVCVDLSNKKMEAAESQAKSLGLDNIRFVVADANNYNFPKEEYDIAYFHASLHHFDKVQNLLKAKIKPSLKKSGFLIINEYVGRNRLQFSKNQINIINEALNIIPDKYKIRFKSKSIKRKFYGPGVIRMYITDPSECIDSKNILPSIHKNFKTIIEKEYGGNILMNVLKDISHHFVELDKEKEEVLKRLFDFEDAYLKSNKSDFVFGLYQKIN